MSELFDQEEIDKYLSGEMGSFEMGLFEHKMAQDEALRYEVEVRRMAISMIEAERIRQLKEYIRRNTPHKRQLGFWQQVTLYSSVACALVAFVFWAMLRITNPEQSMAYRPSDQKHENAPGKNLNVPDKTMNATPPAPGASGTESNTLFPQEVPPTEVPAEGNLEESNIAQEQGTSAPAVESDDYAIKSDEMVLDTLYITPIFQVAALEEVDNYKTPVTKTESKTAAPATNNNRKKSLTIDTLGGYMKSGALNLKVEFWNSPINYRGYRYNGIRLQLYGIADPSKIKFRVIGDELYMWNAGTICKLIKEDRYNSYWPENDKSLLKLFR